MKTKEAIQDICDDENFEKKVKAIKLKKMIESEIKSQQEAVEELEKNITKSMEELSNFMDCDFKKLKFVHKKNYSEFYNDLDKEYWKCGRKKGEERYI